MYLFMHKITLAGYKKKKPGKISCLRRELGGWARWC